MKKVKLLVWADSPISTTGFGRVCKYILEPLIKTEKYEVTILAINHFDPVMKWKGCEIIPAKWLDPKDVYGFHLLMRLLTERKWDLLFVINDLFVTDMIAADIAKIQNRPKIVYYYPVDCRVIKERSRFLYLADAPVAYTNWAVEKTYEVFDPKDIPDIKVIYHGVDTDTYKPLDKEKIAEAKRRAFGEDPPFIITSVNRNNVRKNLPQLLYVFKLFKNEVPHSSLNLHTVPQDNGIDLYAACDAIGLEPNKDVFFPSNYDTVHGFSDETMNRLWNFTDLGVTTTLGEGFGLGVPTEASAAGVPCIAPANTVHPELWEGKAWLYPCDEMVFVEHSGYRPRGRDEVVLEYMLNAYQQIKHDSNQKVASMLRRARKFCEKIDWRLIGKKWVQLFDEVIDTEYKEKKEIPIKTEEI